MVERGAGVALEALAAGLDGLASGCADFVTDRGLDSGPLRRRLWDNRGIRPLIDVREERAEPGHDPSKPILRSLAADGGGNVLRSERAGRRGDLKRIYAWLDHGFGFECHFTRGQVRTKAKLGLALAVMMALG